jgi:hypothetical protein
VTLEVDPRYTFLLDICNLVQIYGGNSPLGGNHTPTDCFFLLFLRTFPPPTISIDGHVCSFGNRQLFIIDYWLCQTNFLLSISDYRLW